MDYEILLYLDVRKKITATVAASVLRGTQHHLLCMLVDTFTISFCALPSKFSNFLQLCNFSGMGSQVNLA